MSVYPDHTVLAQASAATAKVWKLQVFVTSASPTAEEVARQLEALPELGGCTVLQHTHFVELVPPNTSKAAVRPEQPTAAPPLPLPVRPKP